MPKSLQTHISLLAPSLAPSSSLSHHIKVIVIFNMKMHLEPLYDIVLL